MASLASEERELRLKQEAYLLRSAVVQHRMPHNNALAIGASCVRVEKAALFREYEAFDLHNAKLLEARGSGSGDATRPSLRRIEVEGLIEGKPSVWYSQPLLVHAHEPVEMDEICYVYGVERATAMVTISCKALSIFSFFFFSIKRRRKHATHLVLIYFFYLLLVR